MRYTYDSVGNRLAEQTHLGTTTYAYDAADRLTSITEPGDPSETYSYDANGNQTAAGADTFGWDAADRLESATVDGTAHTYTYAGDGRRLSMTAGGVTTQFVWDPAFALPMLAAERDSAGAILRSYTHGLDLISQSATGATRWYHHDGLGSVADVTDASGTSLFWSEFMPFGDPRVAAASAGATVNPFGFTGEYLDPTGLYHLRARQYDPGIGRFLSPDPLAANVADTNFGTYVYAQNRPVMLVDPSGLITGQLCLLGDLGLGFFVGASVCLVADDKGNIGVMVIGEAGGSSLARAGVGLGVGFTDASTVEDLDGLAGMAGGTVNVGPGSATAEALFGRTPAGDTFRGAQVSAGPHLPWLGAEVHGAATWAGVWSTNLFGGQAAAVKTLTGGGKGK